MFVGILGFEVRVGDGEAVCVSRLEPHPDGLRFRWLYGGEDLIILGDKTKVELVHRPYPEGETDATMRLSVFRHCKRVTYSEWCVAKTIDGEIRELQDAIRILELGR